MGDGLLTDQTSETDRRHKSAREPSTAVQPRTTTMRRRTGSSANARTGYDADYREVSCIQGDYWCVCLRAPKRLVGVSAVLGLFAQVVSAEAAAHVELV